MYFSVQDTRFRVTKATISGYIGDPYWQRTYDGGRNLGLCWAVDVETEEDDSWDGSSADAPRIYCDSFNLPVRRWVELEGKQAHFKAPHDDAGGGRSFCYFSWHEPLPYSTLRILERTGHTFLIGWEGVCEAFGPPAPFSLQAQATFNGINVGGSQDDTEVTLRERLGSYINPDDFIQRPSQELGSRESGVGIRNCIFVPR